MRDIRYSQTFYDELSELLEQGIDRFGATVVARKRDAVLSTIRDFWFRIQCGPLIPPLAFVRTPFDAPLSWCITTSMKTESAST